MSSRLTLDRFGRRICIQTSEAPGIARGTVFVMLGNGFAAGALGIHWMGTSGRPPTARERQEARAPFNAPREYDRPQVDDDELDDAEAIVQCRLEQQRQPVDLIGAVGVGH